MHNQRGDPQRGKLFGQRTALRKVLGIVDKELIDLEIDVQAIDQQLPSQFSHVCVVSDVRGPGQLAVGPFDFVKFGPLRGSETCSQVSKLAQFIRMKQCRSIGTVLSAPGSVNAYPGKIHHCPCSGSMCEAIGQSERGSPGMPQDDPLREPPMLPQGIQVSDGGSNVVGMAACGSATGALIVAVHRHQVTKHGCHWLQTVPQSRTATATDQGQSVALANGPERAASNADHLDILLTSAPPFLSVS